MAETAIKRLRKEFKDTVEETLHEELVTPEEAEEIIENRLAKAGIEETESEEIASPEDDGSAFSRDELEERLPEDIFEAVMEHLSETEMAKSLGVEDTDPYLAKMHMELRKEQAEEVEEWNQRARETAGKISEGEAETPILDSVVYDGEEQ
jgi:hypothetical protein